MFWFEVFAYCVAVFDVLWEVFSVEDNAACDNK